MEPRSSLPCCSYTVGLITALTDELIAARAMLDEVHDQPRDYHATTDRNVYAWGRIGKHNVVIASLPEGMYGITTAATTTTQMIGSFASIRFGLLVGIGGGIVGPDIEPDIRLGDVVVSIPAGTGGGVVQYDYGKRNVEGFQRAGILAPPPEILLKAVRSLRADHDLDGESRVPGILAEALAKHRGLAKSKDKWAYQGPEHDHLFHPKYNHANPNAADCMKCNTGRALSRIEREDPSVPVIHYGLIASGNSVIKSGTYRDELAASIKGSTNAQALCFEMEAAGLMHNFPCLVIRGICDYSDSHKNKKWQPYAAMTAAAFGKELLLKIPAAEVEGAREAKALMEQIQEDVLAIKDNVINAQKISDMRKFSEWLNPPDPSQNYTNALNIRHERTGLWFLTHTIYLRFLQGSSTFLWMHGTSGCGKTILASTVIQDLKNRSKTLSSSKTPGSGPPILYFFFDFRDTSKQSLDAMIRSLLVQLQSETQNHERTEPIVALWEKSAHGTQQPTTSGLIATFDRAVERLGTVFLVLDAIDECSSECKPGLLQWILERLHLPSTGKENIQLAITSRSQQEDLKLYLLPKLVELKSCINVVRVSLRIREDIKTYIDDHVLNGNEFQRWNHAAGDEALLRRIKSKISRNAGPMFRLAALQIKAVGRCSTVDAVEKVLQTFPKDLNEYYARVLCQIPEPHVQDAIRLLQLLLSSEEPIELACALEALAVEIDGPDPRGSFRPENRFRDFGPLSSLFSSFVVITSESSSVEMLQLAHSSVKDFLLTEPIGRAFAGRFTEAAAKATSIKVYLAYLSAVPYSLTDKYVLMPTEEDRSRRIRLKMDFPLAELAASRWLPLALCRDAEHIARKRIVHFLLHQPLALDNWLQYHERFWYRPPYPPVYTAAMLGLDSTMKALLDMKLDINTPGGRYYCALHVACHRNNLACMELLLDAGADPNQKRPGPSSTGPSLLTEACSHYSAEVVQLLLERGAALDWHGPSHNLLSGDIRSRFRTIWDARGFKDPDPKTWMRRRIFNLPLHTACLRTNTAVIKNLLSWGADVHGIESDTLMSPLEAACYGQNNLETINLLIEKGADPNFPAGSSFGPLFTACILNDPETVQLLLEKGADVSMPSVHFKSVLNCAARYSSRSSIMKRLLEWGADVSALESDIERFRVLQVANRNCSKDTFGQTALSIGLERSLQIVAPKGDFSLTCRLLEQGANGELLETDESRVLVCEAALSQGLTRSCDRILCSMALEEALSAAITLSAKRSKHEHLKPLWLLLKLLLQAYADIVVFWDEKVFAVFKTSLQYGALTIKEKEVPDTVVDRTFSYSTKDGTIMIFL